MRARRWVGALAVAMLAAGIAPAWADTKEVKLEGISYTPRDVKIDVGDTVKWEYVNGGNHTVTFDDGSFDSNPNCRGFGILEDCFQDGDEPIRRTFETGGKFLYYCRVHGGPGGQGMAGTVQVGDEAELPSSSTVTTSAATGGTSSASSTTATTAATTTTTRQLATSSTVIRSTTTSTTTGSTSTLPQAAAPAFDPADDSLNPDGDQEEVAGDPASSDSSDSSAVPIIVTLLLAVAGVGGALLWKFRPHRGPKPGGS